MSIADDHADGAALASLELLRSLISLLVLRGVIEKNVTLAVMDQAVERLEKLQMGGLPPIDRQAKMARVHVEVMIKMLADLPVPRRS